MYVVNMVWNDGDGDRTYPEFVSENEALARTKAEILNCENEQKGEFFKNEHDNDNWCSSLNTWYEVREVELL